MSTDHTPRRWAASPPCGGTWVAHPQVCVPETFACGPWALLFERSSSAFLRCFCQFPGNCKPLEGRAAARLLTRCFLHHPACCWTPKLWRRRVLWQPGWGPPRAAPARAHFQGAPLRSWSTLSTNIVLTQALFTSRFWKRPRMQASGMLILLQREKTLKGQGQKACGPSGLEGQGSCPARPISRHPSLQSHLWARAHPRGGRWLESQGPICARGPLPAPEMRPDN